MYEITIQIGLEGFKSTHLQAFAGLNQATWFAEQKFVKVAMEEEGYVAGTPIFLNIVEMGSKSPDFYCARYGTEEDAPFTPWHVLTYIPEEGPQLYFTRCGAWVEDVTLAQLYWSKDWAEQANRNPLTQAVAV